MTPPRRRLAVAAATLTLAVLTSTGCGALGQAVDCNTAAQEATKIMNEWTTTITKDATDTKAIGTASKDAAGKTKELAGKYDGEVAAALNDLAAGFETLEKGDLAEVSSFTGKMQGFSTKITSACS